MGERTCKTDGCNREQVARDRCSTCYSIWARKQPRPEPLITLEWFMERVDRSGGPDACHPWTGSRTTEGYGRFRMNYRTYVATRWLLGHLRGKPLVSREMACHHCDNPPCVNPRHLYVGDAATNVSDMEGRGRARHARGETMSAKTHCPQGHPYSGTNLYVNPHTGKRLCRTCNRTRRR